jgi:Xaa-Pro dipeptidase
MSRRPGGAKEPVEIKPGMVFALETYCPATDGISAARIEEEVVVTDKGCQIITKYPADERSFVGASKKLSV